MLNERSVILLVLLGSLVVSISESRTTLSLPTEDGVQRNEAISGEPAQRKTDETSNDLVPRDEIEFAGPLGVRQSAGTQVCIYNLLLFT